MEARVGNRGLAIAGVAFVACLLVSGPVAAENRWGCSCVHNITDVKINFRYKWGDRQWQTVDLQPNYNQAICWNYGDGQHSSPPLTFHVDVDMSNGTAWADFSLGRVQSPGNRCNQIPPEGHYNIAYKPGSNRSMITVFKR